MQFIDQSLPKILPDGRRSASDANILSLGSLASSFQRDVNSVSNEMKGRAALHHERRTRMMSEYENRLMIHGVLAPPPSPALIGPGTAHGAEHIPAHNPGTNVVETTRGKVIIDSSLPIFGAE